MKINVTKELNKKSLLSHIILHKMKDYLVKHLTENCSIKNIGIVAEIKLTVEGEEIDLQSFVDYWQNQVEEMITKQAKELMRDKFIDIQDLFTDLEGRLKEEINNRLEDWEK